MCVCVCFRYYLLPDNLNLDTLLVEDAPKHKMGKVRMCVCVFFLRVVRVESFMCVPVVECAGVKVCAV